LTAIGRRSTPSSRAAPSRSAERGPGIDTHWADYTLIPLALDRELGVSITSDVARQLRRDLERRDIEAVVSRLAGLGVEGGFAARLTEVVAETVRWRAMAETACREGIDAAKLHPEVPVILHHTPGTYDLALEAAEALGPRLICSHSNFQVHDPEMAVAHARTLR
jgi:hypothetical protein